MTIILLYIKVSFYRRMDKNKYIYYIYETAANNGHTTTCQLLIIKGSDVNTVNKDHNTSLHEGIFKNE